MSRLEEVTGTYGGSKIESTIFTYENGNGSKWYVAMGSVNVNCTYDAINEGVDIEELSDFDAFTAGNPIESSEELLEAIRS